MKGCRIRAETTNTQCDIHLVVASKRDKHAIAFYCENESQPKPEKARASQREPPRERHRTRHPKPGRERAPKPGKDLEPRGD